MGRGRLRSGAGRSDVEAARPGGFAVPGRMPGCRARAAFPAPPASNSTGGVRSPTSGLPYPSPYQTLRAFGHKRGKIASWVSSVAQRPDALNGNDALAATRFKVHRRDCRPWRNFAKAMRAGLSPTACPGWRRQRVWRIEDHQSVLSRSRKTGSGAVSADGDYTTNISHEMHLQPLRLAAGDVTASAWQETER